VVRPAVEADAGAVASVHVQAWREAYAHLLPAATLDALDVAERATAWAAIIRARTRVWIAERGGMTVGWASTGPGREEGAPADLELEGLYVLRSEYGSGAGRALLEAAIGNAAAYLWVAAENPRARRFYERSGFVADGTRAEKRLAGTPVDVVRYHRPG